MTKRRNSPLKNLQEEVTATELLKADLDNIPDHEFKKLVIKLIAGVEKSIKESTETMTRHYDELKKAIGEVNNKLEAATSRIDEAERIG